MYDSNLSEKIQQRYKLALHFSENLGLNVIPCMEGCKRPIGTWKRYQSRKSTIAEIEQWYSDFWQDIGFVCGVQSGNLLIFDFDCKYQANIFDLWWEATPAHITDKICFVKTPSNGYHGYCRTPNPEPTQKLAFNSLGEGIIETRGEPGFVVGPCLQSVGHYKPIVDFFINEITQDDLNVIYQIARSFNKFVPPKKPKFIRPTTKIRYTDDLKERLDCASKWLMAQKGSVQGRGADAYAFVLAVNLVHGFDLLEALDDATDLFYEWGQKADQVDNHGRWYGWNYSECCHKINGAASCEYHGITGDKLSHTKIYDLTRKAEIIVRGVNYAG